MANLTRKQIQKEIDKLNKEIERLQKEEKKTNTQLSEGVINPRADGEVQDWDKPSDSHIPPTRLDEEPDEKIVSPASIEQLKSGSPIRRRIVKEGLSSELFGDTPEPKKEEKVKIKRERYVLKNIKGWYYYLLNFYFYITLFILLVLLVLGIIYVLPYLDSKTELFNAIKQAFDYIKSTGG